MTLREILLKEAGICDTNEKSDRRHIIKTFHVRESLTMQKPALKKDAEKTLEKILSIWPKDDEPQRKKREFSQHLSC